MKSLDLIILSFLVIFFSCNQESSTQLEAEKKEEVNIYSHRHYEIDQQIFDMFTEETGIVVNVIKAKSDELINRMALEGSSSPADLLITVDAGRLYRAKEKDLLQKIEDENLNKFIPSHLRDVEGYWYGLTYRARILAYIKDRTDPKKLSTYEALAKSKWENKILTRSSENIYNQSLLASIIATKGEVFAKSWAQGIVNNMARDPKGNDRDQIKAIFAGVGDIAIVNTYYLGKLLNSSESEEVKVGEQIGVFFPDQELRGTHINISGAGVAKYAPNKENAIKLLTFLTTEKIQELYAKGNYEYPVREGVKWSPLLESWGRFKSDTLNLSQLGKYNRTAIMIFNEVGWK